MKTKSASRKPVQLAIRSLVAVSLFSFGFTVSGQEDDSYFELESLSISGGSFASSLAAAAEKKRYSPIIVEALSAEDLGKMPDTSIAESLSRLPGVSSQRVNGRSQVISIRGFPAEFSGGLLNGRELATTSRHRDIEFDQFPAELMNGAVIYKTANSSLAGQGIGGTVDMQTVRPLSYGKRAFATNVFYEWTELGALNAGSDTGGFRYSGTYIDQFSEDKAGIAIGFSHTTKPGQGEQWNAWGYPTVDTGDLGFGEVNIIGGAKPFVRSSLLERDSLMMVLENQPNENIHSTFDFFYSDFQETQTLRGIEIPLAWSSARFIEEGATIENSLVNNGAFENVFGVVRNDVVSRDANVFSLGWNVEIANLGDWTAVADLSYSEVDRVDTVLETYSGTGSNQSGVPDTISYSLDSGIGATFSPSIDYTDTNLLVLTGPQGWGGDVVPGGQVGFLKEPDTLDELTQIKLLARKETDGFFSDLEFGVRYTKRKKSENEAGNFLALANGQVEAPFPTSIGVTDLSFIGISGMASYDPLEQLAGGVYDVIPNPNADTVAVDWKVDEEISQAYAQVGINTQIGSIPVTGNLGLQYVHSDQSSSGLAASGVGDAVEAIPVDNSHSYDDFVPSLNLNFLLNEGKYLRFSAARQIMRQRMQDMRAGFEFEYNSAKALSSDPLDGPWTGKGGDTELEPWRANAIDLSYEHYFKDGMGYWSLAGFYKDLRTFAYTEKVIKDFTGFPFTGVTPATFLGTLEVPRNGEGGTIEGLEFTLSLPGEKFSEKLAGFGAIMSYAYTDSAIQPNSGDASVPLKGFSQKVGSGTLYYEKDGFSARVGARYRSEYRANVSSFGPRGEDFRIVSPETLIDAQVSYTFQDGPLQDLSLILQGYNLNDEPLSTFEGDDQRLVRDYQSYGRSYSFGVSKKF